jgi:protein arginine N-methyltransferase 5
MFQAVNLLSGEGGGLSQQCGPRIQESWEFVHPRPDVLLGIRGLPITNTHNVRSTSLTFHIPHAGVLHGLAGYFEAVLYGSIGLSIHPERMESISKDMLSWFPIFFPFRVSHVNLAYEPVDLIYRPELFRSPSSCQVIRNSMCQCGGLQTRKVWYEWCAEAFLPATILLSSTNSPLTPGATAGESSRIKIGQTSLHNPGGVSSWVGL